MAATSLEECYTLLNLLRNAKDVSENEDSEASGSKNSCLAREGSGCEAASKKRKSRGS